MNDCRLHLVWRTYRAASIAILLCIACPTIAVAAERSDPFMAGLRERRLYSLAVAQGRQQLQQSTLSPEERLTVTIELMRTLAEQAWNTAPGDREPLWREARSAAAACAVRLSGDSRQLLLDVQLALLGLSQGELARREAEVAPQPEQSLLDARSALRDAIRALEKLESQLAAEITRGGPATDENALSADECRELQAHVRFHWARALLQQAQSYAAGSADRAASLGLAAAQLRPLVESGANDPLVWQSRLELAACHRLQGNATDAERQLQELEGAGLPANWNLPLRAERLRLDLAAGRIADAVSVEVDTATTDRGANEYHLAQLELLLAQLRLARQAKQPDEAEQLEQAAVQLGHDIGRLHGDYWRHRADALLARAASSGGTNQEMLVKAADLYLSRREYEAALAAYDDAARRAALENKGLKAAEWMLKAALIEQQRGRYNEAVERLTRLVDAFPAADQAAVWHLQAAWNAAQRAAADPETLPEYQRLLQEHLRRFAAKNSAHTARLWLGRSYAEQRHWPAAVECLKEIPAGSTEFEAALPLLAACWRQHLAALREAGQPYTHEAKAAVDFLEGQLRTSQKTWIQDWNHVHATAALNAARVRLEFQTQEFARAHELLTVAIERYAQAPEAWRHEAGALLVVAQAALPEQAAAAEKTLFELARHSPQSLPALLAQLEELHHTVRVEVRPALASLRLKGIEACLAQVKLPEETRRSLLLQQTTCLAHAGRRAEALVLAEKLAVDSPGNGDLQQHLAELLELGFAPEDAGKALDQWRRVLSKSEPESTRWFQAKLGIARAHLKRGDKTQAAQVLRLTQTLHPDLGGAELKREFAMLLQACEK